jgi:hypothetical protein
MVRFWMILAAVVVVAVSTAAGPVHAKVAMRTFPVLAGAGAHDVYPAGRHGLVYRRNPRANLAASIPGPANRS